MRSSALCVLCLIRRALFIVWCVSYLVSCVLGLVCWAMGRVSWALCLARYALHTVSVGCVCHDGVKVWFAAVLLLLRRML